MLFVILYTLQLPKCRQFLPMFRVRTLFLPFCFAPEVTACTHQHPLALKGFLSPFWLFQNNRGVWEQTLAALCGTTFSPKNQLQFLGISVGSVCCFHLHADTTIIRWLRQDQKLNCFYRIYIKT